MALLVQIFREKMFCIYVDDLWRCWRGYVFDIGADKLVNKTVQIEMGYHVDMIFGHFWIVVVGWWGAWFVRLMFNYSRKQWRESMCSVRVCRGGFICASKTFDSSLCVGERRYFCDRGVGDWGEDQLTDSLTKGYSNGFIRIICQYSLDFSAIISVDGAEGDIESFKGEGTARAQFALEIVWVFHGKS